MRAPTIKNKSKIQRWKERVTYLTDDVVKIRGALSLSLLLYLKKQLCPIAYLIQLDRASFRLFCNSYANKIRNSRRARYLNDHAVSFILDGHEFIIMHDPRENQIGRPRKITGPQLHLIQKLYCEEGRSIRDIASLIGFSRNKVHYYISKMKLVKSSHQKTELLDSTRKQLPEETILN